jgi:hypothetical protein
MEVFGLLAADIAWSERVKSLQLGAFSDLLEGYFTLERRLCYPK